MSTFVDYCCLTGPKDLYQTAASQIYGLFFQLWKRYLGNHVPTMKKLGMYFKSLFTIRKIGGVYKYFGFSINGPG